MNTIRLPLAPGASVGLDVLFEDSVLLAVDKPSGLMISPDVYDKEKPNLMSAVRRALDTGAAWVKERGLSTLANAHRIDTDTSGLLLLVKTREALRIVAKQFNDRSIQKKYLAFVEGEPAEDDFSVEMKLGPHPARPWMQTERRHGGKLTRTDFHVLSRFRLPILRSAPKTPGPKLGSCSLLQCEPANDRMHQIRAHLQYAGYPILCDPLYGAGVQSALLLSQLKPKYKQHENAVERPLLGRMALHAERLVFIHPATQQPIEIVAPLPKDFEVALKYLRKFAREESTSVEAEEPAAPDSPPPA